MRIEVITLSHNQTIYTECFRCTDSWCHLIHANFFIATFGSGTYMGAKVKSNFYTGPMANYIICRLQKHLVTSLLANSN